ncbi:TPA: ankyrin repeat domain-containing protein, partial [Yersinia enterocolitica]|nr:ankyrin repeat domain-containing protein [Yersinia enterocolitica]
MSNIVLKPYRLPPLLLRALKSGVGSVVEFHLSRDLSRNYTDSQGNSPLMITAQSGHIEVCRLLINIGADVEHRNNSGQTALDLTQNQDIISLLLSFHKEVG